MPLLALLAAVALLFGLTLGGSPASAQTSLAQTSLDRTSPATSATVSTAVSTTCQAQAKKTACIGGTLGGRSTPIAGVTVILTDPSGKTQQVVTGADGKFSFTVTVAGEYLVGLDTSTLPSGLVYHPPASGDAGPNGELKVQAVLGQSVGSILDVRAANYTTTTSKVDEILQGAASGILLGLLLALASVGLSLIYGTTGLSNFAHAEQVTLGGMLGYFFCSGDKLGLPLFVGVVLVVITCAATGYVQDRILWRPLRRRGMALTQLMIVTIGLSLALQYVFQTVVGASQVRVSIANPGVSHFGPVTLTHQSLVGMLVAVLVLGGVGYTLLRTRIGRATRAVSDNPGLAAASGIDTDRVISLVWTVAAGLAGLGGFFYALVYSGVKWDSGLQILLLLFAAVTLGGLGTAFGALIGSLVIGLVVQLAPVFGMPGDFKYATPLVILILLLLVRPQGLLGKPQRVG